MSSIMFPEYFSSVLAYFDSHEQETAVAQSDGSFLLSEEREFSLNWVKEMHNKDLVPTVLDAKSHYIEDLAVVEMNQDIWNLCIMSLNSVPLEMTIEQLEEYSRRCLAEAMESTDALSQVLADKNSFDFGIYNVAIINSQISQPTYLVSRNQVLLEGFKISPNQKPLHMLIPVDQPQFVRNGVNISLSQATPEEQFKIVGGNISVLHQIGWEMGMLYDISQVSMTQKDRKQWIQQHQPQVTRDMLESLGNQLGVKTIYHETKGLSIKAFYNKSGNNIVLTSVADSPISTAHFARALGEAVAAKSFHESPEFYMEQELLCIGLHHKFGIPLEAAAIEKLSCSIPRGFLNEEKNLGKLCSSIAKVNRAVDFTISTLQQVQQQIFSHEQTKKHVQTPFEKTEVLENFLRDI